MSKALFPDLLLVGRMYGNSTVSEFVKITPIMSDITQNGSFPLLVTISHCNFHFHLKSILTKNKMVYLSLKMSISQVLAMWPIGPELI